MSNSEVKYQVDHRLLMDKQYEVGDSITLSDKDAKPLLETNPPVISLLGKDGKTSEGNNTNIVNLNKAPEELADRIAAIKVEAAKLDKEDQTKWTAGGMPDANVLTEMLGWKVKAEERNQAWMEVLEAEGKE